MYISQVFKTLEQQLKQSIPEETLFDPGNTPFTNVTLIYLENDIAKEISIGTYLNIKRVKEPVIKPVPSNHQMEECIGLAKVLTASHLESTNYETLEQSSLLTDYGYCSSILLSQNLRAIIAIVASPADILFCYKYVENCVQISVDNHLQ